MKFLYSLVLCFSCYNFTLASDIYRAGIVGQNVFANPARYVPLIQEAAQSKADIIVLPSPDLSSDIYRSESDSYDETLKVLSSAAKQTNMYIVSHLLERASCQSGTELIRSNLVFDRQGAIVAVYRKPINEIANCTTVNGVRTFGTDFGVEFGLLMEEDLVLSRPDDLAELKNFVLTGGWQSEMSILNANQLAPSWAFANNANLISGNAVYSGKTGLKTPESRFAELKKNVGEETPNKAPVALSNVVNEDLSDYTIKPLDMKLSSAGLEELVCHGEFCCEFFIKTEENESDDNIVSYSLVAFDGVRQFGNHMIGVQNCAIVACAGLNKDSCFNGLKSNSTNVVFEKITISGNFTSVKYPIIHTSGSTTINNFNFNEKRIDNIQKTNIDIDLIENVVNFGVLARDFDVDTLTMNNNVELDIYDYIFNEDVQQFFDYVWIRLRVLIFIVSIYVLEMM